MAGWLDDDPNARCVPSYWLPTFSPNGRYAYATSRRCCAIQGWIASLQRVALAPAAASPTRHTQALGKDQHGLRVRTRRPRWVHLRWVCAPSTAAGGAP
jgi:hypothetical protein